MVILSQFEVNLMLVRLVQNLSFVLLALTLASRAEAQLLPEIAADAWPEVRASHAEQLRVAVATEDGFDARNPELGWGLGFDSRGFLVEPDEGDWSWGLELQSYGFAGSELVVGEAACATSKAGRVAYQWDDNCEEWFVNNAAGLEHGFTIRERPAALVAESRGLLTLELSVRGSLVPVVQRNLRDVCFIDEAGVTRLHYSGLTVFDADGQVLPAWFEVAGAGLRLSVDERGANYPLTIDPLAQEVYIKASNTEAGDAFGGSVALFGDTLVVGAGREDSAATGAGGDQSDNSALWAGAVYVYVRTGSTWSQQAYLKASNAGAGDGFGSSVSLSGDTLVVGAIGEGSSASGVDGDEGLNNLIAAGAAYVFTRSGTTWTQQAYLKASNPDASDLFGGSVGISGDTIVIGARFEDSNATGINGDGSDNSASKSGAAYVFVRTGSVWSQQAYLKAVNSGAFDEFALGVAIADDTVVIGAPFEDGNAGGINGNPFDDTRLNSGSAYVFVRSGTDWTQQAYLKAFSPHQHDNFGFAVAAQGERLVVSALSEDSVPSTGEGAVYAFARVGTDWHQQARLKVGHPSFSAAFGIRVAIDGDSLVASASDSSSAIGVQADGTFDDDAPGSGAVYKFLRVGNNWVQDAYIKPSNTGAGDGFGAVAVSGERIAVGAPGEDSNATGVQGAQANNNAADSGAVYIFGQVAALQPIGTSFCFGDGGDQNGCTFCPCGNNTFPGIPGHPFGGCINSALTSPRLFAHGSTSVSLPSGLNSDLRISLEGAPPNSFCILLSGGAIAPNNANNPCFALRSGIQSMSLDGLRCAVSNTRRHGGRSAGPDGTVGGVWTTPWGGESSPNLGLAQAGVGFGSGEIRYFQAYHRDTAELTCGRLIGTSQAIEIIFTP